MLKRALIIATILLAGVFTPVFAEDGGDEPTALYMSRALSQGTPAAQSAAWIQGFLHESGQTLIHHPRLWSLLNDWVLSLSPEMFTAVLPLLRRTFSAYPAPERRQIGEMARSGGQVAAAGGALELDPLRAEKALELVKLILNRTDGSHE